MANRETVFEMVSLPERSPSNGDIILTDQKSGQRFFVVQREGTDNKLVVVPIVADDGTVKAVGREQEIERNTVMFVYPRKRKGTGPY